MQPQALLQNSTVLYLKYIPAQTNKIPKQKFDGLGDPLHPK